jgi:glycosyl transferase family 2
MTLLARDEADIVEAWLAFHLNAGVDFVIATDNRSEDGTTDILERYAQDGYVHLIREPGEGLRQDEWVTRMARLAATDFGADWVINSDADEFWWPRGASLRTVLDAVPARYGVVNAFLRLFVPRPDDDSFFAERMTARFSALAPIHDPASLARPIRKVIHRADPEVNVARGNHGLIGSSLAPLRGWFPIEVFHFPLRSLDQCKHKAVLQGTAFEKFIARPPTAYHANMYEAFQSGRIDEHYDSLVLDDEELARGLAQGSFVVDTRLRDSLRELRGHDGQTYVLPAQVRTLTFPKPTLVDDAAYAVEAALLGEADVVRLQRRLDTLERRLLSLELRLPNRVYRKLSRTAKRALRLDVGDAEAGAEQT